jgi:hypothetical protein
MTRIKREHEADNALAWVMAVGGRRVDVAVRVVNEMEPPEQRGLVLDETRQPRPHEIEDEEPDEGLRDERQGGEPREQPHPGRFCPRRRAQEQEGEREVDDDCRAGEEEVHQRMTPLGVGLTVERGRQLPKPEERDAARENK